jgi:hypothetical protein
MLTNAVLSIGEDHFHDKCEGCYDDREGELVVCDALSPHTQQLLAMPFVAASSYASALLKQIGESHFGLPRALVAEIDVEQARALLQSQLTDVQKLWWLAYGELIGILRDGDVLFTERQRDAVEPRVIREHLPTPDKAAEVLQLIERRFEDPSFEPEDIVMRLVKIVEELTRRVWPSEDNDAVGQILRDNARLPKDSLERRLACIGQALHRAYRNVAFHSINCEYTFAEARFCYAGVRAMIDLWARIEDSRQ